MQAAESYSLQSSCHSVQLKTSPLFLSGSFSVSSCLKKSVTTGNQELKGKYGGPFAHGVYTVVEEISIYIKNTYIYMYIYNISIYIVF